MLIEREAYMKRVRPFMGTELIKVLTGLRRSGKSVMLELIRRELARQGVPQAQMISYNFESLGNASLRTAEALYEELRRCIAQTSGKAYLFFDEIQEVAGWERCVNSCRVDFDCDIYITGSNASLLSGELATYLAGRYVEIVMYPFSFAEYLESRKGRTERLEPQKEFQTFLRAGGMPFLSQFADESDASRLYLKDIYSSVVLKDIIKRNAIRDVDLLERIIVYLMANIGRPFTGRSIARYFKSEGRGVSADTVLNYVKSCCDSYLFNRVGRENVAGKKTLSVNEKYYIADHGIREALYGNNLRDIELTLENIVCMELLRRGYHVAAGSVGEREIDFVATRGGSRIYVQVAYLLATQETAGREFGVYDAVRDNYPKYVVSMDELDLSRNGIRHKNIRDFLLMGEYDL